MSRQDPLKTADIANAEVPRSPVATGTEPRGQMWLPESFEEVRLFALLLWRFKEPNGMLTFLGRPGGDPDGPFKWDFLLEIDHVCINVIRSAGGLELWWWGRLVSNETVMAFLTHNLDIHRADVDATIGSLEDFTLLLNPYARHKDMAELARDELMKIDCEAPLTPPMVGASKQVIEEWADALHDYHVQVDRQAMYSMHLVSESAFKAEAYLNLMYALLLRPVIRDSNRLRDEALLRKWKSKIQHLPSDCQHISKTPDLGDSRVRDAAWLFDLRNKIAHSYPDRDAMKTGHMWFFQCFPVFAVAAPSVKLDCALSNQLPSREEALKALSIADAFIEYLGELVDSEAAIALDCIAGAQPLGYNETKKVYSVPFGRYEAFPVFMNAPQDAGATDSQDRR